MKPNNPLLYSFLLSLVLLLTFCSNKKTEKKPADTPKINSPKVADKPVEAKRGTVINIAETLSVKRTILLIKDSAATLQRVTLKLGEIYSTKLAAIIKKNKLKITGAPVAWYRTTKAPYFFEAGLPVDKKPAKLSSGAYIKQIGTDSIVVAHFYGPYELIPQAYDALKDWMKDHKKRSKLPPYEIYVGDPLDADGKPKDPYKVQTDVVFTWK